VALGEDVTRAVLSDHLTAPIGPQLRAALGFVRKMTLSPEELEEQDARVVIAAGVREEALIDAIVVSFHFNMVDRIADSLGFDLPSADRYTVAAHALLKYGYRLPAPLRVLGRMTRW
jgi:alkylhydroperoxidase family enzyme